MFRGDRVIAPKEDTHKKVDVRGSLFPLYAKVLKMHNLSCLYRIMPICLRLEIKPFFRS
jgi:hypothetical protein